MEPEEKKKKPPHTAKVLIVLATRKDDTPVILGDLEERFHRLAETAGYSVAQVDYWKQTLKSLIPLINYRTWALATFVGEAIRRLVM
mgnify:CR=1 FL=1